MTGRSGWARSRAFVASAVGYQWFYNGANFVAFKVGGDAVHPVLLAALRFGIAAAVVLPVAAWRLRSRPARASELGAAAALGVVMLVGGQALGMLRTQRLPAGAASVFASAAPIFLALFAWAVLREPLGRSQVVGVGLGFAGLALMARAASRGGGLDPLGVGLALAASASWAAGSLWAGRLRLPSDPAVLLAAQLVAAAASLGVAAGATGIAGRADLAGVPAAAWWALAYLVVASTLVGYAVFLAVNAEVSPTVANSFAYVSPVVALLLSALLLGERLTWQKLVAAGVALAGVMMMVRDRAGPDRGRPGPAWAAAERRSRDPMA